MKTTIMHKIFLVLMTTLPLSLISQDLVIIHTNDFHSQIEPFRTGRNEAPPAC